MKGWMLIGVIAAVAGIGLWLYSKYGKEQKVIAETLGAADVEAMIRERPAGVTVSEALKGVTTELVKPGLEEFGVNINPAVDVVARQAGMLDSDVRAIARRIMEGIYTAEEATERIAFIAETYRIDPETVRDMVIVSQSQKSETYRQYAAEKTAGTYTKPWSVYQAEHIAAGIEEKHREVEEFHERRERGETFTQYQRRTSGTTTEAPKPSYYPYEAYRREAKPVAPEPYPSEPYWWLR